MFLVFTCMPGESYGTIGNSGLWCGTCDVFLSANSLCALILHERSGPRCVSVCLFALRWQPCALMGGGAEHLGCDSLLSHRNLFACSIFVRWEVPVFLDYFVSFVLL